MITNTPDWLRINWLLFLGIVILIIALFGRLIWWGQKKTSALQEIKPSYMVRTVQEPVGQTIQWYVVDVMQYCRSNGGKYVGDDDVMYCIFDEKSLLPNQK